MRFNGFINSEGFLSEGLRESPSASETFQAQHLFNRRAEHLAAPRRALGLHEGDGVSLRHNGGPYGGMSRGVVRGVVFSMNIKVADCFVSQNLPFYATAQNAVQQER